MINDPDCLSSITGCQWSSFISQQHWGRVLKRRKHTYLFFNFRRKPRPWCAKNITNASRILWACRPWWFGFSVCPCVSQCAHVDIWLKRDNPLRKATDTMVPVVGAELIWSLFCWTITSVSQVLFSRKQAKWTPCSCNIANPFQCVRFPPLLGMPLSCPQLFLDTQDVLSSVWLNRIPGNLMYALRADGDQTFLYLMLFWSCNYRVDLADNW